MTKAEILEILEQMPDLDVFVNSNHILEIESITTEGVDSPKYIGINVKYDYELDYKEDIEA